MQMDAYEKGEATSFIHVWDVRESHSKISTSQHSTSHSVIMSRQTPAHAHAHAHDMHPSAQQH